MRKVLVIGTIFIIVIIAIGIAGFAYAQPPTPPNPDNPGYPATGNPRSGRGMMGGAWGTRFSRVGEQGYLHDYMFTAIAQALGLTPEELQARHDAGETGWQIAESLSLSAEEFQTLMIQARSEAINQALADGVVSDEQAAWMLERMNQMPSNAYKSGFGSCHRDSLSQEGFSHGPGWRWNLQPTP